jgi:hypothetical protein
MAPPECTLSHAAMHLDTSPSALRRSFERAAKARGGRSEVRINGVRARKRGRLWRVVFESSWAPDGTLEPWRSAENVARDLGCAPQTLRRALQRSKSKGSTRLVTLGGTRRAARKFAGRWKLLAIPTPVRLDGSEASHA